MKKAFYLIQTKRRISIGKLSSRRTSSGSAPGMKSLFMILKKTKYSIGEIQNKNVLLSLFDYLLNKKKIFATRLIQLDLDC